MKVCNRNRLYSLEDILKDDSPPPAPIIGDGILLPNSLLLISGRKKAGKTYLVQNMSVALAAGKSFAGFKIVQPHRVLLLSAEGGYFPNRDRIKIMCRHMSVDNTQNLHIRPDTRLRLEVDDDLDTLRREIENLKPEVVVIDPLVKFHSLDENSARDMANILGRLRMLIEDHDLSIILVHHTGKGESNDARGSSVILGEYDSCIHIIKKGHKDEKRELEFDMRHVETPEPRVIYFKEETRWYESGDMTEVERIVKENKSIKKQSIVEKLLQSGRYCDDSGAYKAIAKAVSDGNIELGEDGLYRIKQ